jgi:hypothetical protein
MVGEDSLELRAALIQSTRTWSPIEAVAEAVSAASETMNRVYVERRSDLYRWSPAHSGGCYPLLRITALFLGADHQRIYIGFRTLPDGTSILCEDPGAVEEPDRWTLVDVSEPISNIEANEIIRLDLGPGQTW